MGQSNIFVFFLPLYGITVMAGLLNVRRSDFTKRNTLLLCSFVFLAVAVNIFVYLYLGRQIYSRFYILWIQIPLYVGFRIISRYRGVKLLFALLTTITLASLPVQFVIVFRILTDGNPVLIAIGFVMSYLIMLFLVFLFLRPNVIYILEHGERRSFWKFCLIPFLYYLYGFLSSGYNFAQYHNLDGFLFRRIPDLIVCVSYILLVDIFKNTNERQLLKNEHAMMSVQMELAREQMEFLKTTQEQAVLYRHDMRHHLSLIKEYLADGEIQKAEKYLTQTQADINAITPVNHCKNDTANLILSSFAGKGKEKGVALLIDVNLPEHLPIPDTELCALLANGLENAIDAASKVEDLLHRKVSLNLRIKENRLLLYIENNYTGIVVLENGLPVSNCEGHGFGTKSMAAIAAKRKGYCSCEADGNTFILRIVLPLDKK